MVKTLFILLLIVRLSYSFDAGCIEQYDVKENSKSIYGGLNTFYGIAKGIADGLQRQLSNSTMQDLYKLFNDKSFDVDTHKVVNEIFKSQAPSIIFASAGVAYIVVAAIAGIGVIIARCVFNSCNSDKENARASSKVGIAFMIFLLIVCFAFILTSVIIFNISATHLYTSIEQSDRNIANVVNDLSATLNTGSVSMDCAVSSTINKTFNSIENNAQNFSAGLGTAFLVSSSLSPLQDVLSELEVSLQLSLELSTNVSTTAKKIENGDNLVPACSSDLESLFSKTTTSTELMKKDLEIVRSTNALVRETIKQFNSNFAPVQNGVNAQITQITNNIVQVQSDINKALLNISGIVEATMEIVNHLQNAIDDARIDIVTDGSWGLIKGSVRAIMLIPNVIALFFSLFAIIVLFFYLIKPTDHPANRAAGYIMVIGAYLIMFLTILSMGIAVTAFFGGWAISGSCKSLFEDDTFRIYSLADELSWKLDPLEGPPVQVSARDILVACYANETVFRAVKGDQIISTDMIDQNLNLDLYSATIDDTLEGFIFTYQPASNTEEVETDQKMTAADYNSYDGIQANFLPNCDNQMSASFQILKNTTTTFLNEYKIVSEQMTEFSTFLITYNDPRTATLNGKSGMINYTNVQFTSTQSQINVSTQTLLNELDTNIFPGIYLFYNFENGGTIMCDTTGKPVHGLWASAGLAAIFFIPLSIILFCASSTLFSRNNFVEMDKLREEKKKERERSEKKKREVTEAENSVELFTRPRITALNSSPEDISAYYSPYADNAFQNTTRTFPATKTTVPKPYLNRTLDLSRFDFPETHDMSNNSIKLRRYTTASADTSPSLRRFDENGRETVRGLNRISEADERNLERPKLRRIDDTSERMSPTSHNAGLRRM